LDSAEEGTAVGEDQRVTNRPPQNRDQACDTKALCENREDILLANQATVKRARPGRVMNKTRSAEVMSQALWPGPGPEMFESVVALAASAPRAELFM